MVILEIKNYIPPILLALLPETYGCMHVPLELSLHSALKLYARFFCIAFHISRSVIIYVEYYHTFCKTGSPK